MAALIRHGPWFFLIFLAGALGGPGLAAQFIVADGGYQGKAGQPFGGSAPAGGAIDAAGDPGGWRLVRSSTAASGNAAAAILRTADFERSDPRLAGLLLRCGTQGIEAVIVVVEPFPPHARPRITLRTAGQESHYAGSIIPTGAGIRLPGEAADLVARMGTKARELEVKVNDGDAAMGGVVALSGLSKALEWLNAECVQK